MSRNELLKYRVRCSEEHEYRDVDQYEYFKTVEEAMRWARKAAKAGRFKNFLIQDMGAGYGNWVVIDEVSASKQRRPSN